VLLNFASGSPFYDIDNSFGATGQNAVRMLFIHNCSLTIGDIVNLRLGDKEGIIIRKKVVGWRFWIRIQAQFDHRNLRSATDQLPLDGTYYQSTNDNASS